jgi:preprotein translocase subunit SecD
MGRRVIATRFVRLGASAVLLGLSLGSTPVAGAFGRLAGVDHWRAVAVSAGGRARVLAFEKPVGKATSGALARTVHLVARRLLALDIADPRAYSQGSDIVIDIPKAGDDLQVLKVVTEPGRLLFRPVDCEVARYRASGRGRATVRTLALSEMCHASSARQASHPTTSPEHDTAGSAVLLPSYLPAAAYRFVLGPAEMTGSIIKTAIATLDPSTRQWTIALSFTAAGSTLFNHYAAAHYRCYEQRPYDPPYCAQQALDLDGSVLSAPYMEAPTYNGSAVISGPTSHPFSHQQATGIAALLRYGPLPVRLLTQELEAVTPTHPHPK